MTNIGNDEVPKEPLDYFPPWCAELIKRQEKARAVNLSWRKPWRVFRWLYLMHRAGKVIPKSKYKMLGVLLLALSATSCGSASSDEGIRATIVPGPAGVTCYAIIENGRAVGGNCK